MISSDIRGTVSVTAWMRTRRMVCSSGIVGRSRSHRLAARLAARRLQGIAMFARGVSQAEVARRLGVTREAVRQWVDSWRTGGPAALAPRPSVRKRRVELVRIAQALEQDHRPSHGALTTRRVRQIIERAFVVRYCASSARSILHRLGFSYSRKKGWQRPGAPRHREASRPRIVERKRAPMPTSTSFTPSKTATPSSTLTTRRGSHSRHAAGPQTSHRGQRRAPGTRPADRRARGPRP
jgi:transposase